MNQTPNVDWTSYATQYDLLLRNPPPYQCLLEFFKTAASQWHIPPGAALADCGGGTGNFSTALAALHPDSTVFHIERDEKMLELAQCKADELELRNWRAYKADFAAPCDIPNLHAIVFINSLYTTSDPHRIIRAFSECLQPDGYFFASDPGRKIDLLSWTAYLLWHSVSKNGFLETISIYRKTAIARKVNKSIRQMQDCGRYWLHSLAEFENAFSDSGLKSDFRSDEFYRGQNDTLYGRKSKAKWQ